MKFEKVTVNQWKSSVSGQDLGVTSEEEVVSIYEEIKLPKRATELSAGYDFFAPFKICLNPGETLKVPTGIRVLLDDDKYLAIYPRSGQGFKYRLRINNTVGIIDADYSRSDNEGHIFIKLSNEGDKVVEIDKGVGFAQGIISQYFKVEDDESTATRNGGEGSTSKIS